MESKYTENIISTIGPFGAAMFMLFKEANSFSESTMLVKISFIVILVILFGIFAANFAAIFLRARKERKSDEGNMSTSSILSRSRKVAKDLKKVIRKVDKTVNKYVNKRSILSKERKQELLSTNKNIKIIAQHNKGRGKRIAEDSFSYFEDVSRRKVTSSIRQNEHNYQDISKLNETVLTSIKEMNRALLVLEQYDTRIFAGDYVLKHSTDVLECATALIDYKGWTHSLLGRTRTFKKEVNEGIAMLEEYLKTFENDIEKDKVILKLARAYRHLGSDQTTVSRNPRKAYDDNEKALKYITDNFKGDKANIKEVIEMRVGIEYGQLYAQLYDIKNNLNKKNSKLSANTLLKHIKDAERLEKDAKTFDNPHRYLKVLLLKNEFIKLLAQAVLKEDLEEKDKKDIEALLKDIKGDNNAQRLFKLFMKNTTIAEKVFEKAIYADEMMEIYINQEVVQLFKEIQEIASK